MRLYDTHCHIQDPVFDQDQPPGGYDRGVGRTFINSPQSLVVLLRNGSAPTQLLRRTEKSFIREGQLEGVSREVQLLRAVHFEEQRSALLQLMQAPAYGVQSACMMECNDGVQSEWNLGGMIPGQPVVTSSNSNCFY